MRLADWLAEPAPWDARPRAGPRARRVRRWLKAAFVLGGFVLIVGLLLTASHPGEVALPLWARRVGAGLELAGTGLFLGSVLLGWVTGIFPPNPD